MSSIKTLASLLLLVGSMNLQAQIFSITEGSINTCIGAFLDSGGQGASGYGNNENFTSTICPDDPTGAISLQWITFNLSLAGIAPVDQITIHDGPTTADPVIGTWTGSNSPGIVSATFTNTSGCLTVVFTSNNTGTGVFAGAITCFAPCEPPSAVASITGLSIPALVCQGEVLTFDGSASTAAVGFNVVDYLWDFADGSLDSTSGSTVQHSFSIPGEYVVQLTVTDDNNCVNTNVVDLQVLVSTTPIFLGTTPSTTICQGESVTLDAVGTPVQWSALPESNLGNGIFLPDLTGVPFSTDLTFTSFSPGQTLTDIGDIPTVCVNMEHSFMGDLVISMTCPNGQSVTFHQQGGGGTFLGVPVDNDATPDIPGTCWDYCWSPTATNGTWVQNSGGTLASGTYQSLDPMTNLIGCPLNGTWTITFVDLWGSDNGFLCSWALNFDPSLFPSLTQYTPVLGLADPDSAAWSGTGFVPDPTDPTIGVATPPDPGVYDYVFTVMDNFGCSYDTTIQITVEPTPQGPILITGDNVVCDGSLAYLNAPPGYDTYIWSNGAFGPNISGGAGTYVVTVSYGNCSLPSEPFVVTQAATPTPVIDGPPFSCGGLLVELNTTEPYASYAWSNGATTPTVEVGTGSYTVTVTTAEGCSGTSVPYVVLVGANPTAAFTTEPGSPQIPGTTVNFTDLSEGNGSSLTQWDWDFGTLGETSTQQNPGYTYNEPGTYVIQLIVTTAEGCTDTAYVQYTIRPEEILIPNVFSPNNDGINDLLVIENVQYYRNHLAIYNRWGQLVFEATDYQNNWRALDVADGTYFYLLLLTESDEEFTGHVTILR